MSFGLRTSFAVALGFSLTTGALAGDGVRLSKLAAASGYSYQWSATESGVTLQRPGIVIVLHAGYALYEVNAIPTQADRAPAFTDGDLIVSDALAERLRRLAIDHPRVDDSPTGVAPPVSGTAGQSAVTISVRQIPGRDALALSGTAPANVPVTVTLTGEPSRELPFVVLSRTTVFSRADGTYALVATIGQDTHHRTAVVATATSGSAGAAVARIFVDSPSPMVDSILDEFPPK